MPTEYKGYSESDDIEQNDNCCVVLDVARSMQKLKGKMTGCNA